MIRRLFEVGISGHRFVWRHLSLFASCESSRNRATRRRLIRHDSGAGLIPEPFTNAFPVTYAHGGTRDGVVRGELYAIDLCRFFECGRKALHFPFCVVRRWQRPSRKAEEPHKARDESNEEFLETQALLEMSSSELAIAGGNVPWTPEPPEEKGVLSHKN